MSVTNDIDQVIKDISIMEHIDPTEYMIIYKDSAGIWDGFNVKTGEFEMLNAEHWRQAVKKYIDRQLELSK